MPYLSVIVANYNNSQYLPDCLDSVLCQTYQDLEILVCDDCSTDDSLNVLKKYQQRYPDKIRLLCNDRNQGVTRSRHLAIEEASGEYLTTLDSDDYYCEKRKLESEMAIVLQDRDNAGRDVMAYSNIRFVKSDKTRIGEWGNSNNIREGYILNEIISRSCMIPRDFVFRKDNYFEVGGFDSHIPLYEDWDLKIRLAKQCEFRYSGALGTAYRRHGGGLSAAPKVEHIRWLRYVFSKNLSLVAEKDRGHVTRAFLEFQSRMKQK